MKQHYVYLTTNNINNRKYIGKHTGELDDNYLGSGTLLQQAIKKYGKENFTKEILYIGETEEDAFNKERELIQQYNAVKDENFYNIHEGGDGGNATAGWNEERMEQFKREQSERFKGEKNPRFGCHLTEETKQKIRENRDTSYKQTPEYRAAMSKAVLGEKNGMYGRHHTEESKRKMSEAKKGKKLGKENGNHKGISAYEDAELTILVKHFDTIQEALIYVGTKSNDYSGITKRMKLNKPYKGYYWQKDCDRTSVETK